MSASWIAAHPLIPPSAKITRSPGCRSNRPPKVSAPQVGRKPAIWLSTKAGIESGRWTGRFSPMWKNSGSPLSSTAVQNGAAFSPVQTIGSPSTSLRGWIGTMTARAPSSSTLAASRGRRPGPSSSGSRRSTAAAGLGADFRDVAIVTAEDLFPHVDVARDV